MMKLQTRDNHSTASYCVIGEVSYLEYDREAERLHVIFEEL
jgi:hypothetical protein